MGYTIKPGMVRVDFFKESGKWLGTGAINMALYLPETSVRKAIYRALDEGIEGLATNWRLWLQNGGTIVVLDPYHKHAHPIMLKGYNEKQFHSVG